MNTIFLSALGTVIGCLSASGCTTERAAKLAVSELSAPNTLSAWGDSRVARAYGQAALLEAVRADHRNELRILFQLDTPVIHFIEDGNSRRFVFVGYRSLRASESYYSVFENCPGDIAAMRESYSGFTNNLAEELKQFQAASGARLADFPRSCRSDTEN